MWAWPSSPRARRRVNLAAVVEAVVEHEFAERVLPFNSAAAGPQAVSSCATR